MKITKKTAGTASALLLGASILAGCGKGECGCEPSGGTTTPPTTTTPPPVITPANGQSSQPIQVSIANDPTDPKAADFYTVDGTDPEVTSTCQVATGNTSTKPYTGVFTVSATGTTTIKAVACDTKNTTAVSDEAFGAETITPIVTITPPPTVLPQNGTATAPATIDVSITDSDANATILFTSDGTKPVVTANGQPGNGSTKLYQGAFQDSFVGTTLYQAVAFDAANTTALSSEGVGQETIAPEPPPVCATTTQIESANALALAKLFAPAVAAGTVQTSNGIEYIHGDFSQVINWLNNNVYAPANAKDSSGTTILAQNADISNDGPITTSTPLSQLGYDVRRDVNANPDGSYNYTINIFTTPVFNNPHNSGGGTEVSPSITAFYFSPNGWRGGVQSIDPVTCKPEAILVADYVMGWDGSTTTGRNYLPSTDPIVTTVEPVLDSAMGSYGANGTAYPENAYDETKAFASGNEPPYALSKNEGLDWFVVTPRASLFMLADSKQMGVFNQDAANDRNAAYKVTLPRLAM